MTSDEYKKYITGIKYLLEPFSLKIGDKDF